MSSEEAHCGALEDVVRRKTDRQAARQPGRQPGRQTDRQAGRQPNVSGAKADLRDSNNTGEKRSMLTTKAPTTALSMAEWDGARRIQLPRAVASENGEATRGSGPRGPMASRVYWVRANVAESVSQSVGHRMKKEKTNNAQPR